MRRHFRWRAAALTTACFLTASTLHAEARAATPSATVTLRFATGDRTAYRALIDSRPILTPARQRELLARALPQPRVRAEVVRVLAEQTLRVIAETPWTVTAEGTEAQIARFAQLAQARQTSSYDSDSDSAIVVGPLAGLATHVLSSLDAEPVAQARFTPTVVTGENVRMLYGAPIGKPAPGQKALTIATVQLSGWDSTELTAYASTIGLPDPIESGQYAAVSVLGADPSKLDDHAGDLEVAMDQQALLATAPYARQRAYFAPNSAEGFVAAIEQVAADASSGGASPGIAALSISWGACERTDAGALRFHSAMNAAIQDALLAGITVFAASGDNASRGCGDDSYAVDFPASSPWAIGVGGTTGDVGARDEHAWSLSGGGESRLSKRPSYQAKIKLGQRNGRLVPDIAAVGDPRSGIAVYNRGHFSVRAGTSLAAPLAAATLTTTLAARGFETGVGFILPNLYGAPATSFRDITVGSNGWPARPGYDMVTGRGAPLWNRLVAALDSAPKLSAPTSNRSRVIPVRVQVKRGMQYRSWRSGVGEPPGSCTQGGAIRPPSVIAAPRDGELTIYVVARAYNGRCYTVRRRVFIDTVGPTANATAARHPEGARFTWRARDAAPSSGRGSYSVTVKRVGSASSMYRAVRTTTMEVTLALRAGATYRVTVYAYDGAGNRSAAARTIFTR